MDDITGGRERLYEAIDRYFQQKEIEEYNRTTREIIIMKIEQQEVSL